VAVIAALGDMSKQRHQTLTASLLQTTKALISHQAP
jgi:hypothetical protein